MAALAAETVTVRHSFRRIVNRVRYGSIYNRFRSYTMLTRQAYEANLEIAATCERTAGSVVECGVWRGGMIAGIGKVLGPERNYYLCDSFEGLPAAQPIDGAAALAWQADLKGKTYFDNCRAEQRFAEEAMALAGVEKYEVVRGWFDESLPAFQPDRPIALLRVDADWYESTMSCLQALSRYLAPDGLVIVDDYSTWDGCARAVHRFLADSCSAARIDSHRGVALIRGLGRVQSDASAGCGRDGLKG